MQSNDKNDPESPSSSKLTSRGGIGGTLILPTLGLAECYSLIVILEEKLTKEANTDYGHYGNAVSALADASGKLKLALEAIGEKR